MAEVHTPRSAHRNFDGMTVEEVRRSLEGLPDWAIAWQPGYGGIGLYFEWIEKEVAR